MWIYQTVDNWGKDIFRITEEKGIFVLYTFDREGTPNLLDKATSKYYREDFAKNNPAAVGRKWICWEKGAEFCIQILEHTQLI